MSKVAVIAAVLAGAAALVGTGVYVMTPDAGPRAPMSAEVPPGTILFQDNFENGLTNWVPLRGIWSIAKGKGVGGSDCLQVEQEDFLYPLLGSPCDPGCTNFEVSFKVFLPTAENVWIGLMCSEGEWAPSTPHAHTLWESIGGAENGGWRKGKWRDYRCIFRGNDFERITTIGTNVIKREQFKIGWVPGRRPGLQIAWFKYGKGPFVYVDDFVVKKIE